MISPRWYRFAAFCAALIGFALCPPTTAAAPADDESVLQEVREFMAGYAHDLATHDREAIVARYHPKGALMVVDGVNEALPAEAIGGFYRTQWEGPKSFEWVGLNYHVLSPAHVVVTGAFHWHAPQDAAPHKVNFSALLVREKAGWRIRAEMEFKARTESAN